jgi:CheY-like chemotaxis protein
VTLSGKGVLLVGHSFRSAQALEDWLKQRGFRCHFARNMREASALLRSRPVDLVLSNTHLADASGFHLLMTLTGLPVTAFLCLPVEDSCFWLPAIDDGQDCLGSPALRPREFASALLEMVRCLPAGPSVSLPVPKVEDAYVTFAESVIHPKDACVSSPAETEIYSN